MDKTIHYIDQQANAVPVALMLYVEYTRSTGIPSSPESSLILNRALPPPSRITLLTPLSTITAPGEIKSF